MLIDRRRCRRVTATVLVLGGLLAGCSGPGDATPPQQWAGTVCGALAPWRTRIADLNAQAQSQMAAATTPEQTRDNLLALLAGAEAATEQTRAALVAAGNPDVTGGAEIAHRFAASLEGARDAYAHAETAVRALSTADKQAFYASLVTIFNTLNEEYSRSGVNTSGLDSPELRDAFAQAEQCR